MSKRHAFTLIELLVVIAVISLLAAILFPVFAQAKVAAKGTASLSNIKQLGTAFLLYVSDHDDMSLMPSEVNAPDAPFGEHRPWSFILLPYVKSALLFQDPLTSPYKPDGWTETDGYSYHTQIAYVWQIHSPALFSGGLNLDWNVQSQTVLANPAETLLMATKRGSNIGTQWWWGSKYGVTTWNTMGVPYCRVGRTRVNPNSLCGPAHLSWGNHSVSGASFPLTEGYNTSGFAYRKNGQGTVLFADFHARSMSPAQLAVGTNWTPTLNNWELQMVDPEKYLWDAD